MNYWLVFLYVVPAVLTFVLANLCKMFLDKEDLVINNLAASVMFALIPVFNIIMVIAMCYYCFKPMLYEIDYSRSKK